MYCNLSGHVRNDASLCNNRPLIFNKQSVETVKSIHRYKLNQQWATEWKRTPGLTNLFPEMREKFLCVNEYVKNDRIKSTAVVGTHENGQQVTCTNTAINLFSFRKYDFSFYYLDWTLFRQEITVEQICHNCCWLMFTVLICDIDKNSQHEQY